MSDWILGLSSAIITDDRPYWLPYIFLSVHYSELPFQTFILNLLNLLKELLNKPRTFSDFLGFGLKTQQ
jgi:hypothetical protein